MTESVGGLAAQFPRSLQLKTAYQVGPVGERRVDAWSCPCGGRRTVRAIVTHPAAAEAMLRRPELAGAPTPRAAAQSPPRLSLAR